MTGPSITRDWTEFDPKAYLAEYYADLDGENRALLQFFVDAYRDIPPGGVLLDFGGGPTIYPLIAAATKVKEVHFSDFLDANLEEVRKWLRADASAFDWHAFIGATLELENGGACTASDIVRREGEIRKRITRMMRCDASRTPPIDVVAESYDIIVTNFCAESATGDRWQWRAFLRSIASLLKPGGRLLLTALKGATYYHVGPKAFPAVSIVERDLIQVLMELGFPRKGIALRTVPADRPARHYRGLILAVAVKEHDVDLRRKRC